MKVLRIVVLLLALVGGVYAVRRFVGRNGDVSPLDPLDVEVPLAPVPDAGART